MKDVVSVLFSNLHAVQARMDSIQRRLDRLGAASAPVEAPKAPASAVAQKAGVEPFFPRDLAYALKPVGDRDAEAGPAASEYDDMIESSAQKNGVDADLVKAVIKAESGFRKDVVSPAGAVGLMQLMPSTAASLGASDPYDPAQNIEAGTRYLKSQIDRFGNTELALAAYNAGPGSVVKYGGVPPFNETRSYVSRVMGYLGQLKESK